VTNKHAVSRRVGYADAEALAPGQMSEAYHCIRYALGKVAERPTVCRTPTTTQPALLPMASKVVEE